MTKEQKQTVKNMRLQGMSYGKIADLLKIPKGTVQSFCRRNIPTTQNNSNETPKNEPNANKTAENLTICKQCKQPLEQKQKCKPKTFCCDKCRFDWWNANRDKPSYKTTCVRCGNIFSTRGNKSRKYCSHSCFIANRYAEVCHDNVERAV